MGHGVTYSPLGGTTGTALHYKRYPFLHSAACRVKSSELYKARGDTLPVKTGRVRDTGMCIVYRALVLSFDSVLAVCWSAALVSPR